MDRDEFQAAFWAAKRAMTVAGEGAYNRHGVRAGQQFILQCLWEKDGQAPGEIAKQLGLSTPTVTRAASRMEVAGLLRREPHPSDARLVRICLTARGQELRDVIASEMAVLTGRALAGIEPAHRVELVRLLHTIQANLGAGPR